MPLELAGNPFGLEVLAAETIGGLEVGNRRVGMAQASKQVSVHVVGMRDGRRQLDVGRGLRQRVIETASVLVGVRQVVVPREMTRGDADRLLVEPPGARRTPLPTVGR